MFFPCQNLWWNPYAQCDGLRRWGPVGGDSVGRVEPLWMGLMPSLKRPHRVPQPLLPCEETMRSLWPRRGLTWPYQQLDLRLWTSGTVRNRFLWFVSHSAHSILLQKHKWAKREIISTSVLQFLFHFFLWSNILCTYCLKSQRHWN